MQTEDLHITSVLSLIWIKLQFVGPHLAQSSMQLLKRMGDKFELCALEASCSWTISSKHYLLERTNQVGTKPILNSDSLSVRILWSMVSKSAGRSRKNQYGHILPVPFLTPGQQRQSQQQRQAWMPTEMKNQSHPRVIGAISGLLVFISRRAEISKQSLRALQKVCNSLTL